MPDNRLLPPNSTTLEKAVDATLQDALDLPLFDLSLWDPATCPVAFLPILAWGWQVQEWDSGWTTSVKRAVIAAAIQNHYTRGTVGAIKRAIAAVGVRGELLEYFDDPDGVLDAYKVKVFINDNISEDDTTPVINDARLASLARVIEDANRGSQEFDILVGVEFSSAMQMAAAVRTINIFKMQGNLS